MVVLVHQEGINMQYTIPAPLPKEMFRTYDIRGEANEQGINEGLAYAIGRGVATELLALNRNKLVVGRDGRLTGPALKKALIQGILDTGVDVIDIGIGPSPLVYFATNILETDSGIMVTASHNPAHHNGFKIVLAGKTLTTDRIQSLYQRIEKQDFSQGHGKIIEKNIVDDYINTITTKVKLSRPLKVVIDCGNGAASDIAPKLFETLGCDVVPLFCEMDGRFPNHHPDPSVPENLQDLIKAVKQHKADIGLAFDGDADRLGVVTNKGEIIWPDRQLMLVAIDVLSRNPNAEIVFDVKCTHHLAKVIEKHHGRPVMFKTGHSILKQKMFDLNAPLAGEMSGHIFFKEDWYGFDDGIYVGARILKILADSNQSSAELFGALPNSFNTPELKLPMPEEKKAKFMEQLLTEADFGNAKRITIDGLRIEYDYGWGLVRPSNTSPYLILRFEADAEDDLQKIQEIFRKQLLNIDSHLKLPF